MADELKPCPFCGGEVEIDDSEMFTCLDCGLIARFPNSPKQIKNASMGLLINNYDTRFHIMRWNTRHERTCHVRQAYFDSDDELSEIMEGISFSPEDTVACICESCGHDWRYDRGIRPEFCPNCGAKVVK